MARALLAVPLILMSPGAAAQDFAIDWQGAPEDPAVAQSLTGQIALVKALPVSAEMSAFFRAETIHVDREPGTKTRARRRVFFAREVVNPNDPVLLHELIHRWQLAKMASGTGNRDILRLYEHAKASGAYPARAYMLTSPFEFFAMTASVVLHGRASRPPFTRATVRAKSPELYAFIVREFGLRDQPAGTSSITSRIDSNAG